MRADGAIATVFVLTGLGGCAFDAGEGFATIESADLTVTFDPGSRRFDDGSLLVVGGYRFELDEMTARFALLSLLQAELSGGGGSTAFSPVVSMPISNDVDVAAGLTLALAAFEPSRFLPQTTIARASLELTHFVVRGRIGGGAIGDSSVDLVVDLALTDTTFVASFSPVEISRDSEDAFRVTSLFTIGPTILDGVDYAALSAGGPISIGDASTGAGATIVEQLADYPLSVGLTSISIPTGP